MTAPVQKTVVATVADDCTEACAAAIRDTLNPVLLQPLIAIVTEYAVRRIMPTIVSYREFLSPSARFHQTRDRSYNVLTHDGNNKVRIVDFGDAPTRTIPYRGKTQLNNYTQMARSDNDEFIFYSALRGSFEVGTIKEGVIQHHSTHGIKTDLTLNYSSRFSTCLFHDKLSNRRSLCLSTYRIDSTVRTFSISRTDFLALIEATTLLAFRSGYPYKITNIDSQPRDVKCGEFDRHCQLIAFDFEQTRVFAASSSGLLETLHIFSLPDMTPLSPLKLEYNAKEFCVGAIAVNSYAMCAIYATRNSVLYDLNTGGQMLSFPVDVSPTRLTRETFVLSDDYLGVIDFVDDVGHTRIYDLRDPSKPINGPQK